MIPKAKILILFFILAGVIPLFAQAPVKIIADSTCPADFPNKIPVQDTVIPTEQISQLAFELGYPFSSVDRSRHTLRIHCGPCIRTAGFKSNTMMAHPTGNEWRFTDWNTLLSSRQDIITDLADRGFPYTKLDTRLTRISGDTLYFEYDIDTVKKIFIREINILGNLDINPDLFQKMIGVTEQEVFSWSRVKRSENLIKSWGFAEFHELRYDFDPFGVNLEYVIDRRDPSKFDVLIALVPSPRPDQQYELTGNAYLDLSNQLKLAERIFIKYDKYSNQSQSFDLQLNFPYIPIIRSGILARGMLDRRDSSILDVSGKAGLQYQLNPRLGYALYLQQAQSRLTSVDSALLAQRKQLPEQLDYNWSALGTSIYYHSVNNHRNPSKGSVFRLELTGGLKKIIRNGSILQIPFPNDEFSFSNAYDSLRQNALKFEISGHMEKYLPTGKYSTVRLRLLGGWNFSSDGLLENEKFRLGGFQNYRGFPEKIFFADWYGMGSAEYRFLFDEESNAYLFSDFGFFGSATGSTRINYPYSLGIGLNLGTKAGIFGISYALGGHRDQRLSFSEGRINFGLVVNY